MSTKLSLYDMWTQIKEFEMHAQVLDTLTVSGIENDPSGTQNTRILRRLGWRAIPVVDWDGTLYAILSPDVPHPGHNTAEVINVSEFNRDSEFHIIITKSQRRKETVGQAWIFEDERLSILTDYHGQISNYSYPQIAVLSYRIVAPTADDVNDVMDQLDTELQEFGPRMM